MKKQYNEPQLYVENVVVESGIAASITDVYIEDAGYIDLGDEL